MDIYKQKYEQAFERAKNYHKGHTLDVNPQAAMEYVFPELKEREDEKKPNGGIVFEDFNEGNGYYKVNIAYLNTEQVKEIENLIEKWNPKATDEIIKECIGMALTDVPETRFKSYNVSLRDCLAWLEKQGKK